MDRLVSIPKRVFEVIVRGKLEGLRVASKVSIPERVLSLKSLLQVRTSKQPVYHMVASLILFMSLDPKLIALCYDTS